MALLNRRRAIQRNGPDAERRRGRCRDLCHVGVTGHVKPNRLSGFRSDPYLNFQCQRPDKEKFSCLGIGLRIFTEDSHIACSLSRHSFIETGDAHARSRCNSGRGDYPLHRGSIAERRPLFGSGCGSAYPRWIHCRSPRVAISLAVVEQRASLARQCDGLANALAMTTAPATTVMAAAAIPNHGRHRRGQPDRQWNHRCSKRLAERTHRS
jgi:hypothetical protein